MPGRFAILRSKYMFMLKVFLLLIFTIYLTGIGYLIMWIHCDEKFEEENKDGEEDNPDAKTRRE